MIKTILVNYIIKNMMPVDNLEVVVNPSALNKSLILKTIIEEN